MAEYVAELRRLTIHCKFGDFLSDALRDRLVCGLRNASSQKKLLAEKDLSLKRAIEIAQASEAAEYNAKKLQATDSAPPVYRTEFRPERKGLGQERECYRCGGMGHHASACRFKDAICNNCKKRGHLARVCRGNRPGRGQRQNEDSRRRQQPLARENVHNVDREPGPGEDQPRPPSDDETMFTMFRVGGNPQTPMVVTMEVNGKLLTMEVDTGAAVSVISTATRDQMFPDCPLINTSAVLTTYTGERMPLAGEIKAKVKYGEQRAVLTLFVVEGVGPNLLGRDWLQKIRLDWKSVCVITSNHKVQSLIDKFPEVFEEELGAMNTFTASLQLKPGATPKFVKARPPPFALKEAIEQELNRLEEAGIIEKVRHSQWASPVVPVPKANGRLRLCGDYKITINPSLEVDKYPFPKPEDLFATLAGGRKFTKIDLTNAYQQMVLEEESRELVTINTHKGLYRYTRLPFGVASAPALFQKTMDTVLQGLPKVICYLDDILITGDTDGEHLSNVEQVLERLKTYNIRARKEKCCFLSNSVEYLGHRIDANGLHTTDKKVEAISAAPEPKNVQELRSFLGLLQYYGKFLPNLAMLLQPLHSLLKTGIKWVWSEACAGAFKEAKQLLMAAPVLAHYDPSLPMKMAGDASAYGIGAVISHVYPDGSERPVAYASRTLSSAEQNYAQIEKEALSLVFGVRKFHQYLYGRQFVLVTDHKPLTSILGPKKGIPPLAAARLQRWALLLSAYSYTVEFKPTQQHANADGLSRLPLPGSNPPTEPEFFVIGQLQALPVTTERLQTATRQDQLLSRVHQYVREGWPVDFKPELKPFECRKQELSTEGECLLWGNRVIVPQKLRARLVEELHRDHPGVTRMKSLARSYLWWPGLDKELEDCAKSCVACQAVKSAPAKAPLHPWLWPAKPWQRVHVDFAGPFLGKTFLIVVDAHSKWPEVMEMTSTTALKTIMELRKLFAAYGLPEQLVSDNGPQFVSEEFAIFLKSNGIKHIRCSPYHPSSNGAAERFVQSFKQAMKAGAESTPPISQRLSNFSVNLSNHLARNHEYPAM